MSTFADWFTNSTHNGKEYMRDSFVVLTVLGTIILAIAIWANYFRQSPKTRRRREHRHALEKSAETTRQANLQGDEALATADSGRARRKRKRRREHRPRNPTLAETRGLPPPRPEGMSPRGT